MRGFTNRHYTTTEVSRFLKRGDRSVRRLVASKRLPAKKLNGVWLVRESDLVEFKRSDS